MNLADSALSLLEIVYESPTREEAHKLFSISRGLLDREVSKRAKRHLRATRSRRWSRTRNRPFLRHELRYDRKVGRNSKKERKKSRLRTGERVS